MRPHANTFSASPTSDPRFRLLDGKSRVSPRGLFEMRAGKVLSAYRAAQGRYLGPSENRKVKR
jgi:hypothetical protein